MIRLQSEHVETSIPQLVSSDASIEKAAMISQPAIVAQNAWTFAARLRTEIGPANLQEVIRRNALPAYRGCCASHDFCDANMPMMDAFEGAKGRPVLGEDGMADADCDLVNAAWDMANANAFFAADV